LANSLGAGLGGWLRSSHPLKSGPPQLQKLALKLPAAFGIGGWFGDKSIHDE